MNPLIFVILGISAFPVGKCIKRTGGLSPASISAVFCWVSAVFCGLTAAFSQGPIRSKGMSFRVHRYPETAELVVLLYIVLSLLAVFSCYRLGTIKKYDRHELYQWLRARLDERAKGTALRTAAAVVGVASLVHAVSVLNGWSSLWLDVIWQASGILGITCFAMLAYGWKSLGALRLLLIVSLCYHVFSNMLEYSRFAALIMLFGAIMLGSNQDIKSQTVKRTGVTLLVVATLFLGAFALHGRQFRPKRVEDNRPENADVAVMLGAVATTPLDSEIVNTWFTNIVQGPFVSMEAIGRSTSPYDERYVYLSFSPLPGPVDGWKDILPLQKRINYYTPYNAWAELVEFGLPFFAAFCVFYCWVIRLSTKVYMILGRALGGLFMSPGAYALFYLHQYPVRSSFRILLMTGIVAYIMLRQIEKRLSLHVRHSRRKFWGVRGVASASAVTGS